MSDQIILSRSFSRRDFIKISAVLCSSVLAGHAFSTSRRVSLSETRRLMGTYVNLTLVGDDTLAVQAVIDNVFSKMAGYESIFSLYLPQSQINQLNRQGYLIHPDSSLVEVIREAKRIGAAAGGAFDLTIQPVLVAAAADQPSEAVEEALDLVGFENVIVDDHQILFNKRGMAVTLDGVAKGFIVDQGLAALQQAGYCNALVEAGGDLAALGQQAGKRSWRIGIRSPRAEGLMGAVEVSNRAVATSGDYMQAYTEDFSRHHIIDPRLGLSPRHTASATVITGNCLEADALATAAMVLGMDAGLALLESLSGTEGVMVSKDLKVAATSGFPEIG